MKPIFIKLQIGKEMKSMTAININLISTYYAAPNNEITLNVGKESITFAMSIEAFEQLLSQAK